MIGFVRIQTNVSRCKEGVTCDAEGTLTFPLSGRCDVIVVGLRFGQQRVDVLESGCGHCQQMRETQESVLCLHLLV